MKNIENIIFEAIDNGSFIFSYFDSIDYKSELLNNIIKEKISSDSKSDIYSMLFNLSKSNSNFNNTIYLSVEHYLTHLDKQANTNSILTNFLNIILQTEEEELSFKQAFEHIKLLNIQEKESEFDYFIIYAFHFRPNLIENIENDDKIALKKVLCRAFNGQVNFSEKDQYHILIKELTNVINKNWAYFKREILRYIKMKSFVDLKKNRQNLFSWLKSFKYPFISILDVHQIDRFVTSLNVLINEHPETTHSNYYDYYHKAIKQLKSLIFEFESKITFFASISYLPLLRLVIVILESEHNTINESIRSDLRYGKPDKKFPLKIKEYFELEIPIYYHSGNSQAREVFIELFSDNNIIKIEPLIQYSEYLDENPQHKIFISRFKLLPISDIQNETELEVTINWKSIFGKDYCNKGKLFIKNIDSKIKWGELREVENPYSLNAKEELKELFGRDTIIKTVKRGLKGSQSFKIFGQKRVGKTSIAKSLYNYLKSGDDPEFASYIPAYLSIGQVATSNDILGDMSCFILEDLVDNFRIKRAFLPFKNEINPKDFAQTLTKFISFLKNLLKSYPDIKVVIFIDEFDELPSSLYQGESGKSFFMTLKSITDNNNISIIVIGGEKLQIIFAYQGIRFNLINDIAVDYFDIIKNKEDLKEIILYPSLETNIDFSESAIEKIIEYSAGNPYYVMLLSSYCFDEILKKEMSSVDGNDISKMIKEMLEVISIQHFQHFWEDGKIGTPEEEAWWAYNNSKLLILISQISYQSGVVKYSNLKKIILEEKILSESELELYLEQLVRRKIVIKYDEEEYKIRVRLMEEWLRIKGNEEINLLFKNTHYLRDAVSASKKFDYTEENIRHLEKKFESYYKTISKEDIRIFLLQFRTLFGSKAAWYAYKIIENIKLYSRTDVERYYSELFKSGILSDVKELRDIKEGTTQKFGNIKEGPTLLKSIKYQNIIISQIDSEGKSGSKMLNIFAQANNILDRNVITSTDIKAQLEKNPGTNYLIIFVDDFIGTGDSAIGNFEKFFSSVPTNLLEKHHLYYCVICAFIDGKNKLDSYFGKKFRKIIAYEYLDESNKVFSDQNNIFSNDQDRGEALRIFKIIGQNLEKKHPLGYKEMQSSVIFWDNAPNDTLPALIKSGKIKIENEVTPFEWNPLFQRK